MVSWVVAVVAALAVDRDVASVAPLVGYALAVALFAGVWGGQDERALRRWLDGSLMSPRAGLLVAVVARFVPLLLVVTIDRLLLAASGLEGGKGSGPDALLVSIAALLQMAALCTLLSLVLPDSSNSVVFLLLAFGASTQVLGLMDSPTALRRAVLAIANPLLWGVPERTWTSWWGPLLTGVGLLAMVGLLAPGWRPLRRAPLSGRTLELRGVRKEFGGLLRRRVAVLRGMSFGVRDSTLLGLVGRNGAGKTTTLRIVLGQIPASDGEVILNAETLRVVRLLPEGDPLAAGLKPRHYLPLFTVGVSPERVGKLAEMLHVVGLLDTPAGKLSAGQRRRCALLLTLAGPARVYLLDEPSGGIDPVELEAVKNALALVRSEGAAVVLSTHLLREFDDALDEAVLIEGGRVLASGRLAHLRDALAVFEVAGGAPGSTEAAGVRSGSRLIVPAERAAETSAALAQRGAEVRRVPTNLHDVFLFALERGVEAGGRASSSPGGGGGEAVPL